MIKILSYSFLALSLLIIILGQIKGFHMTEGEKFINLWDYWVLFVFFGGISFCLFKIGGENEDD